MRLSTGGRFGALGVALTLLITLGAPAATAQQPPGYAVDPAALPFEALPGTDTERFSGVAANGAGYRIEVPADWNGSVVMYAHGFVSALNPVLAVQNPQIREHFVTNGYAWAASSYRANGYVVEEGVEDTQALLAAFPTITGRTPRRSFLHGVSMGGHITGVTIERYPDAHVGALPVCGVMGDLALFDYFQDYNLLAQALAGVDPQLADSPTYLSQTVPATVEALGLPDDLNGDGLQFRTAVEELSGGERAGFEAAFDFWNGDVTALGGLPFVFGVYGGALSGGQTDPRVNAAVGNADRTYSYDPDPAVTSPEEAALNAAVLRDPAVAGAVPPFPVITGDIPVKTVSMHTTGDLFVPFSMEQIYAAEAAASGTDDLLVTRAVRDVRHCGFADEELERGFDDLVAWVDGAPEPAGDDVLDPDAVADRDFGCAFTVADRPGLPACGAEAVTERLAGPDRVRTAVEVSRATFERADAVVLARADQHADALAGAPLAGSVGGPVLLSFNDRLTPEVTAELRRLDPDTVYLMGGETALSAQVARDVEAIGDAIGGVDVRRIAGRDRFQTAADAARLALDGGTADEVFVVQGRGDGGQGFADAVAVSALAAFLVQPVLLVERDRLPDATAEALRTLDVSRVTVVGGPAAVSEAVVDAMDDDDTAVERLAGGDRYTTSVAVARRAVASGMQVNRPFIATGTRFPDALTAGPAAAATGDVLLLVDGLDARQPGAAVGFLAEQGRRVQSLRIAGDPNAVSAAVAEGLLGVVNAPR